MAATLEKAIEEIRRIKENALNKKDTMRPRWPMIILRSPKGWTGPKEVDGLQVEGTFRAHQVPLLVDAEHPTHVKQLESWMKSYKAEELFDENGRSNRNWPNWRLRATDGWGLIHTPTADLCCTTSRCRIFAFTRSAFLLLARWRARIRWYWANSCEMWPN